MRKFAIMLALGACHSAAKPEGTGSATASSGRSAAGSDEHAVPAAAPVPQVAHEPAPPPTRQPQRSKADADRISEVEHTLTVAIAKAKQAKTLKEACSGLGAISQKLDTLHAVTPPAGFEQEFAEARNGILMELDVMQDQRCSDDSGADADTIRGELDSLQKGFVKLQQVGAKP